MSKRVLNRVRRYLQGHSVDMDGVKIQYELDTAFKPCIWEQQ